METNKITSPKTFTELFGVILNGNKDDSRKAAREVRKLLYGSRDGGKYESIKKIIENAPDEYRKIKEEWREENFVMAISVIYFLHSKEAQPDFLFPWLFDLLQHENGYIRHATVRMFSIELGPLTAHIRFPEYKPGHFGKLTSRQADIILYYLFINLNELSSFLWQPRYKRYKYIDSLPASPYKSTQMVLSDLENLCGKEYIDRLTYIVKSR